MNHHEDETRTFTEDGVPVAAVIPPGSRIQQFEILSLLGSGGMGQVYVAHDHRLDRKVAIKRLRARMSGKRESFQRFQREARAASALNHPNIVTIFDSGESTWGPYIVMELIRGRTLRDLIHEGLPLSRALDLAAQTVEAASVAHAAGIVHRDLKPDNILVRDDGYVKVVDFGLARPASIDAVENITAGGLFVGTLRYASPEQSRGDQVDQRSDVFSLGLILYQMTTGRHPFEAGSALATLSALASAPAIPASTINPKIPAELDALILRMLEKDPADRPAAAEVAEVLKAAVSGSVAAAATAAPAPQAAAAVMVGRGPEFEALTNAFELTESGRGTLVCVAGEAGMGKSTLVDSFIGRLAAEQRRCLIGSGRSSQRLAGADAYAPLLEALAGQLRTDRTGRFAREMKLLAPSWYAMLASESDESGTIVVPRANSQDRMKQELCNLFRRIGRDYPIVLVFEDFHWADLSTADAVVYLADRFDDLRLLLILSYRESELLQIGPAFVDAKLNMQARGLAHEIRLQMLSEADVERYLAAEFPRNRFPQELPDIIYRRTGGHPLFVSDLVRYLREFGGIREDLDGTWVLDASFEQLQKGLPKSVRSMVERKLSGLSDADRRLLSAAAVQDVEFDSAVLARVLEKEAADVEERLEELDHVFALVALVEESEMPDRTLTCRYRFRHILYQDYCIGLLRPSRRAALSGATARSLEAFHGARSPEIAAKLALLFESAREFRQAAEYFLLATANATTVFAHREAAVMARRGLDAVLSLPASPERDAQELRLQLALGSSLCMTSGYASPGTVECFSRALDLATHLGREAQGPQIWGLWMAYAITGNVAKSRELSDLLFGLEAGADDPSFHAAVHYAAAISSESVGRLRETREHIEEVLRAGAPGSNRERMARFVVDPVVAAGGVHLRVLTLAGLPGPARERWAALRACLDQRDLDPRSLCDVLISGGLYHVLLREPEDARDLAARAVAICERFDIFLERQWATFIEGWAQAELGASEAGLGAMRGFLNLITTVGCLMHHSLFVSIFAEALLGAEAIEEAREWIRRGLDVAEKTGQRYFESELYRLAGELEMRPGGDYDRARVSLVKALDVASDQDARLLEMRAALSLATFLVRSGDKEGAARVLSDSVARMPSGFEAREFSRARAVLRELS